jgi:hypothetical protein
VRTGWGGTGEQAIVMVADVVRYEGCPMFHDFGREFLHTLPISRYSTG